MLIFNWNKSLICNTFKIIGKKNTEYISFVVTNIDSMSIDNPNIQLVIQLDLFINFDLIIKYMSRAEKKD